MNIIEIKGLKKEYIIKKNKKVALDNINLEVKKGELIAIMGASGSGKTTLLNIIGCMDRQSEGEYKLKGRELGTLKSKELSKIRNEEVSFVFQNFSLMKQYTVFDNVLLPLYFRKMSKKEKKKRVLDLLEEMGIEDQAYKKPEYLSGGQQQRVAIARAICSDSDIILADEPTGALDKKTGEEVMEILLELNKKGKTIIIVTHDRDIATFCKKIIHISDGKIVREEKIV